jgi:hypothetical protein
MPFSNTKLSRHMNTIITVTDKTILYGSEDTGFSFWCQKNSQHNQQNPRLKLQDLIFSCKMVINKYTKHKEKIPKAVKEWS